MQEKRPFDEKKHESELDDFWDISELIPKKRAVYSPHSTETVEITLPPVSKKGELADQKANAKLPLPSFADQPLLEYVPEHAMLHRVRLFAWKSGFGYYDAFVRDAVRLYPIHGERCERVSDFYRMSQYSQMSRPQLEWYLWWRENFRNGVILETDYGYLLLYANELINLSDKLLPTTVLDLLCKLWISYRESYPQLDLFLPEWICHCALIHKLPSPSFASAELTSAAMQHCRLREFYLSSLGEDAFARALLAFCSNYDYQKSKFYQGEHRALFDRVITGAMQSVMERTEREGKLFSSANLRDHVILLDAYMGALCPAKTKRRIEVSYCSFSRSHELRFLVTDIVKYTENRLRQAVGIRSRLTVYALPPLIKDILDGYLSSVLPARERAHVVQEVQTPDYEHLYDAPTSTFSFDEAEEIERLSWDTTKRLVEAFGSDEEDRADESEPTPMPITVELQEPRSLQNAGKADALMPYLPFLRAVAVSDREAQREAARSLARPTELVIDEINTLAVELYGDILLEENDGVCAVIEDYADLLADLLA
ncbi:MAG: TerB N-terminal domain-containing protein [Clostridia bacterium]|nr:TerB N-terminal domain-containing protein [Clostridia bacterium]